MAAQIKDYAYSDNAAVLREKVNPGTPALRGKVNPGTPALREKVNAGKPVQKNDGNITAQMKPGTGVTAQMKDLSPPSPLARDTSRATLQAKSQEMRAQLAAKKKSDGPVVSRGSAPDRSQFIQDLGSAVNAVGGAFKSVGSWADEGIKNIANTPFMPGTRDYIFGTQKSTLDKEGERLAAASSSNTFKPSKLTVDLNSPGKNPVNGSTNTVPSKLIGAQQEAGTSRFDRSKLTLGNNPYTGQVGMFKNGEMISNQDAATVLGQKGKGQFLGKFSAPVGGVTDFTNLFSQDQKLFQAQMAAVNRGEGSGIFTGPADPGAGRYGQGSQISALQSRRDMLQSKIDLYNKNNPITKGSSVGDIISNTVATQQMRDEIKHIDDTIFGKNDLANKIQQEIIRMQSGENEQNLRNKGALESQHIAGNYGLMQQELQNKGAANTARIGASADFMKNMLGGKPAEFGKTKSDFVYKNSIELQKDQAKTLYNSQIEAGKSHEEATSLIKASFPDLYSTVDDDEKKVEDI